jgi:hypothetical protein
MVGDPAKHVAAKEQKLRQSCQVLEGRLVDPATLRPYWPVDRATLHSVARRPY